MINSLNPAAMSKPADVLNLYRLPGRLNVEHTALLLGFAVHDIPVLMQKKLLRPLGKPAPNAPKYFASSEIEQLRQNPEWLSTATKVMSEEWKRKRQITAQAPPEQKQENKP